MPDQSLGWDEAAEQLTRYNTGPVPWQPEEGTPLVLTYSYRETDTPHDAPPGSFAWVPGVPAGGTFHQFSSVQIAVMEIAIGLIEDVANIVLNRIGTGTEGPDAHSDEGQIRIGAFTDGFANEVGGLGGYWYWYQGGEYTHRDGMAYFSNVHSVVISPNVFNHGMELFLHEMMHTMSLPHPSDYDALDSVAPTYENSASYIEDTRQYSIMSYFSETHTGANWHGIAAMTPMLHDIAALQKLYGANMSTRTGDTVYGFNSNTGLDAFTFSETSSIPNLRVFTIWDADGEDTLDFSGFTHSTDLNLNEEAFSSAGVTPIGAMVNNIAIARGAIIENAIGGSGDDTITGNEYDNEIDAGDGLDTIYAGDGNDTILNVSSDGFADQITLGLGADTLILGPFSGPTGTADIVMDFGADDVIDARALAPFISTLQFYQAHYGAILVAKFLDGSESIVLVLEDVAATTVQADNFIFDDPVPPNYELTVDNDRLVEGDDEDNFITFTISRDSAVLPGSVRLFVEGGNGDGTYYLGDSDENTDFFQNELIEFLPGEMEQTIRLHLVGDEIEESHTQLVAGLSIPDFGFAKISTAIVQFIDNDGANAPAPAPAPDAAIHVGENEAENLDLESYRREEILQDASGGANVVIDRAGATGTVSGAFSGVDGLYQLAIDYYAENDGQPEFEVLINNVVVDSFTAPTAFLGAEKKTQTLELNLVEGDVVAVRGTQTDGAYARIDKLTFTAQDQTPPSPAPQPTPVPTPEPSPEPSPEPTPDPTPAPIGPSIVAGRTEVEALDYDGYRLEQLPNASGGANLVIDSEAEIASGTVTGTFYGADGSYDLTVEFFAENDGTPSFDVLINGVVVESFTAELVSNWFAGSSETLRLDLSDGDVVTIRGHKQSTAYARLDALVLTEVAVDTPTPSPTPVPTPAPTPAPEPTPTPTPDPSPQPTPSPAEAIMIEAETIIESGYVVENNAAASQNAMASLLNGANQGVLSYSFEGTEAIYTLDLDVFDESDGQSPIEVRVNGQTRAQLSLDGQTGYGAAGPQSAVTLSISGLVLKSGDVVEILGEVNAGEFARIDALTFTPEGQAPAPTPEPTPEPTPAPTPVPVPTPSPQPTPSPVSDIEIEAETLISSGFVVENIASVGNGVLASLAGGDESGVLSYVFEGGAANYVLQLDTFDENDGVSTIAISINGALVETFTLDANLPGAWVTDQTAVTLSTSALALEQGDRIEISATRDDGELVRIDKLSLQVEASGQAGGASYASDIYALPQADGAASQTFAMHDGIADIALRSGEASSEGPQTPAMEDMSDFSLSNVDDLFLTS